MSSTVAIVFILLCIFGAGWIIMHPAIPDFDEYDASLKTGRFEAGACESEES